MTAALSLALSAWLYGEPLSAAATIEANYDSRGYLDAGTALWAGQAPPGQRLSQRGYLYPLVAVGLWSVAPQLLVLAQTAAIAAAVGLLADAERRLAGRIRATPIALLSVSLLLAPAHMMTESLALFMAAGALWCAIQPARRIWAPAGLAAAALIKPALLPVAAISLGHAFRRDRSAAVVLALVLVLVAPQLFLSARLDGRISLSNAGAANFTERFYPAVAGQVDGGAFVAYPTPQAQAFRALRPALGQQVAFVLGHPVAAARTWAIILWESHLTGGSGFVQRSNATAVPERRAVADRAARWLNLPLVLSLLPALGGCVIALRRWPGAFVAPLTGLGVIATAPLVYWQGDRVVLVGLIALLPFAGLGLSAVARSAPPPPDP